MRCSQCIDFGSSSLWFIGLSGWCPGGAPIKAGWLRQQEGDGSLSMNPCWGCPGGRLPLRRFWTARQKAASAAPPPSAAPSPDHRHRPGQPAVAPAVSPTNFWHRSGQAHRSLVVWHQGSLHEPCELRHVGAADRGRHPQPLGHLQRGPLSSPAGGGHWLIVVGLTRSHLIVHNPLGEADRVNGTTHRGTARFCRSSRANYGRRWMLEREKSRGAVLAEGGFASGYRPRSGGPA
jgi:hypothetical protein